MEFEFSVEWVVTIGLWALFSGVILFLPELLGVPGYPLFVKIVVPIALAPIAYMIVKPNG